MEITKKGLSKGLLKQLKGVSTLDEAIELDKTSWKKEELIEYAEKVLQA